MWYLLVALASAGVAGWAGFRYGFRSGRRRTEEEHERMLRIEPPRRTPGMPTNHDADPSSTIRSRWRPGQFKSGPAHRR